jgi:hypothetical protein
MSYESILHEKWFYANIGANSETRFFEKNGFLTGDNPMDFLLTIHSILRWIIIAVSALTVFKFAVSWAGNQSFKGMDRGLAAGFSGLLDTQVLLGLIFFLWSGFNGAGFPAYRWEHMIIMIIAAALGHVPSRLKALGDKQRFFYSVIAILGAVVLVFVGVMRLPGGWTR